MPQTQANRHMGVKSPLGDDVLLLRSLAVREEISRLFEIHIELLSEDSSVAFEDLIGQKLTIWLKLANGEQRYFNGYVSDFQQLEAEGHLSVYQATVVPWFWLLSRTTDCRIFQDKTVPEIVKEVFADFDFADFEEPPPGDYQPRTYCVQYRESTFNFISRLLEEEGIYYYFKHQDGAHTLVLTDDSSTSEKFPGYEELPFRPSDRMVPDVEAVSLWHVRKQLQPGTVQLTDYDFTKPKVDLTVESTINREHSVADSRIYDYPGGYTSWDAGDRYAQIRIEEIQGRYELIHGSTNAPGLCAGYAFKLVEHPRADQERDYLVTSTVLTGHAGEFGSGGGSDLPAIQCEFDVIDMATPYRPERLTHKPVMQGPQTAIVVGEGDAEVHTEEYSQIKVRFHWDHHGETSDRRSAWVRVSQAFAGSDWGGMFIPHAGQEVIVDFLEGNPDAPIVTGRVYNADNMPPLELPGEDHKSVIRDHYGNELVFDGTPGDEHIVLRSPHHDSGMALGKSSYTWTSSDHSKVTVGDSKSKTYGDTSSLQVGDSESWKLGSAFSLGFGDSTGVFIGGKFDVMAGAALGLTAAAKVDIGLGSKVSYYKGADITLGTSEFIKSVDGDITLDSNSTLRLVAGDYDQSKIEMDKNSIQILYGRGKKAAIDESLKSGAKKAGIAAGVYLGMVGASVLADLGGFVQGRMDMAKDEKSGLIDKKDHAKVQALQREQWTWDCDWKSAAAAGLAVALPPVLAALHWYKGHKARKAEAKEQGVATSTTKHSIVFMNEKGLQLQTGQDEIFQMSKQKGAALVSAKKIKIMAEKDVLVVSKSGKAIDFKASEVNIKSKVKHANLLIEK